MYINNKTYDGEISNNNYSASRAIAAAAADDPSALHIQLISNIMEKAADMLSSVELQQQQQQQQQQKHIFGGDIVDLRPSLVPNITYTTSSKYCSSGEFVLFIFYITCFIVLIIIAYCLDIGHANRYRKPLRAPTPPSPPLLMSSTPFVERKIIKEKTPSPSLSSEPVELVPVFQSKNPYKTGGEF